MTNAVRALTREITFPLTTPPTGFRAGLLGGGAAAAVGGAALLEGEANGFARTSWHSVDAERVAVKASSVVTAYAAEQFLLQRWHFAKADLQQCGRASGWQPHNICLRSQEFNQTTPWNPTICNDGDAGCDCRARWLHDG